MERALPSGTIRIWDFQIGKEWKGIAGGSLLDKLTFSPDGQRAFAGRARGKLQGSPLPRGYASGKQQVEMPLTGSSAAAFSPDGRHVAVAESRAMVPRQRPQIKGQDQPFPIRIVDLATGQLSAPLTGHRGSINALAFSPDGKLLISGSDDTTVLLWDLAGLLPAEAAKPLSAKELASCWNDLAGDAKQAYPSMWKLADDPGTIELFQKELKPATATATAANDLRGLRAIEVLERIKTPAAKELLLMLAGGLPESPITQEARQSLTGIIQYGREHAEPAPNPPPPVNPVRRGVEGGGGAANKVSRRPTDEKEAKAAEAIEKLGGRIGTLTTVKSEILIFNVDFRGAKVTDEDLKKLTTILKDLKNLQRLYLGNTKVTDAGLKELKDLKNLTFLGLLGTKVTADGR